MAAAGARELAGACLCGAVRYAVEDAFEYAANCHCGSCRRTTGSAFKPFAGIERSKLRLTAGADGVTAYGGAVDHNVHCATCSSLLYSVVRDGAYAHVAMGTLTDAPGARPTAHIFVAEKALWFTISDDLPQHAGHASGGA